MPYSTARKILRRILHFYPCKIKPVHMLHDGDKEVFKTFTLQFLARMVVVVTWPWYILWTDEAHFCTMGKLTLTIVEFGQRNTVTKTAFHRCSMRVFRCPNSTIVSVNLPIEIEAKVSFISPQNVPWPSGVNHYSSKELQCKGFTNFLVPALQLVHRLDFVWIKMQNPP